MKKIFNTSGLNKNKSLFFTVFPEGVAARRVRGTVVAEQQTPDRNTRGQIKGGGPGLRPSGAPLRSGFTLIELLVVVLIIGILAAVALPQYNKAVKKSRAMEAFINLEKIVQAQRRYQLENNTCTTDLAQLDIEVPQTGFYRYACSSCDGCCCYARPTNGSTPYFEWAGLGEEKYCRGTAAECKDFSTQGNNPTNPNGYHAITQ